MSAPQLVLEHGGSVHVVELDREPQLVASLDENARIALGIEGTEYDVAYRLFIGTEAAELDADDAIRSDFGGRVYWRVHSYLESARGPTVIRVESRAPHGDWRARGGLIIDVRPGKLGEAQYRTMFDELHAISPALVHDVHGKSGRAGGALAGSMRDAWDDAERALIVLARRSRSRATPLARRASHARDASTDRARHRAELIARVLDDAERPSIRRITSALDRLARSMERIRARAAAATSEIEQGRPLVSARVRGRSLYEIIDEPRRTRIDQVRVAADDVLAAVRHMRGTEPFARARPLAEHAALPTPQSDTLTRRAEIALRRVLRAASHADSGGSYVRPTSRLYEAWVFLRVARALAALAGSPAPLDRLLEQLGNRGFGSGLPRGTSVEFALFGGRSVALTFEPTIHARAHAEENGALFFRLDAAATAPLMPDLLLTFGRQAAPRVVIMEAKYLRALRPAVWDAAQRYYRIGYTATGRAAQPDVWIVAPIATMPDASNAGADTVPAGWRGGLLPLLPGSTVAHAYLAADEPPHTFVRSGAGGAGTRGRHAETVLDGTAVALRAVLARLLYD